MKIAEKICILLVALAFWLHIPVEVLFGQMETNVPAIKINLAQDFKTLKNAQEDSTRFKINGSILNAVYSIISSPKPEDFTFDSIKALVRVTSENRKFDIFHWNLQEQNGRHRYFGFLRINQGEKVIVYPLHDIADSLPDCQYLVSGPESWVGALYYKIIDGENDRGEKFYTLLGWSGQDNKITAKVIDILTISYTGEPKFGLPVFKNYAKNEHVRVVFRFSANTMMTLKYERQVVSVDRKWNSRKREFETKEISDWMIIVDRLLPYDPMLEGQFQYYIPSGDINDGFIKETGGWRFIQGIETRNAAH